MKHMHMYISFQSDIFITWNVIIVDTMMRNPHYDENFATLWDTYYKMWIPIYYENSTLRREFYCLNSTVSSYRGFPSIGREFHYMMPSLWQQFYSMNKAYYMIIISLFGEILYLTSIPFYGSTPNIWKRIPLSDETQ